MGLSGGRGALFHAFPCTQHLSRTEERQLEARSRRACGTRIGLFWGLAGCSRAPPSKLQVFTAGLTAAFSNNARSLYIYFPIKPV